jgi:hypothetical protein
MRSGRLLDDLLVVVARHVRRWTDRILAEQDRVAPAEPHDPWEGDAGADDGGPPAHWLEMVRARAPHLLEAMDRPRRPAPRPHEPRAASPRIMPGAAPSPLVAVPPIDPTPVIESGNTRRSVERPAAVPPVELPPAAVSAEAPAELAAKLPTYAPTQAQRLDPPPHARPATSTWVTAPPATRSSPTLPPSPSEPAPATRSSPTLPPTPSEPAPAARVRAAVPDTSRPSPEPATWRWRIESLDQARPPHRRSAFSAASADRALPPAPPRAPASPPGELSPVHPPPPASLERWRSDVPDAFPPATLPWQPVPARVAVPAASSAVVPAAPFSVATPPVVPSHDPPGSIVRSSPWSNLSDEEPHTSAAGRHPTEVHPARPLCWPRLPDEDEHDSPTQAAPADPTWPVLPGDELAALEDPAPGEDPGRYDRLRREQQGVRWSERRF